MISRLELEGKWNQVKGRVLEHWGELTDNDLKETRGDLDELTGIIQEKTGESKKEIQSFLDEIVADTAGYANQAAATARQYAEHANEAFHENYDQVSDSLREGYAHAEGMVRKNPVESVAVAFGAGLIAGAVVGLVLKSK